MEVLFLGSSGANVKLIQSLLARIGYNPGPIDGVLGYQTQQAIILFQTNYGLIPDGVVGETTWKVFNGILMGYARYTIKQGDTLFNIAKRFYTNPNAILTANQGLRANGLTVGQTIVVPYGNDIVFTDIDYTYEIMEMNIRALKIRYPFLEVGIAGKSVMGKNIYYIRMGTGTNQVFYNASHHAIEWIGSILLMKFAENYAKAYSMGGNISSYSIPDLWKRSSIYIIPMVNPDGVDLVLGEIDKGSPFYQRALRINTTGLPLQTVWKANIEGTDLNLNYPAGWEIEKQGEAAAGITGPEPSGYAGAAPLSAPETAAVSSFTKQHNFRLVIAYHTQGNKIYYQFQNLAPAESLQIAQRFAQISGYSVEINPPEASYAGYKDWFIQEYRRPGFTIEVGLGTNPIPTSQFNTIYQQNEGILLLAGVV